MKKECWSCGRNLMEEAPELGQGYFKCECGATWIKMPKVAKTPKIKLPKITEAYGC